MMMAVSNLKAGNVHAEDSQLVEAKCEWLVGLQLARKRYRVRKTRTLWCVITVPAEQE